MIIQHYVLIFILTIIISYLIRNDFFKKQGFQLSIKYCFFLNTGQCLKIKIRGWIFFKWYFGFGAMFKIKIEKGGLIKNKSINLAVPKWIASNPAYLGIRAVPVPFCSHAVVEAVDAALLWLA